MPRATAKTNVTNLHTPTEMGQPCFFTKLPNFIPSINCEYNIQTVQLPTLPGTCKKVEKDSLCVIVENPVYVYKTLKTKDQDQTQEEYCVYVLDADNTQTTYPGSCTVHINFLFKMGGFTTRNSTTLSGSNKSQVLIDSAANTFTFDKTKKTSNNMENLVGKIKMKNGSGNIGVMNSSVTIW